MLVPANRIPASKVPHAASGRACPNRSSGAPLWLLSGATVVALAGPLVALAMALLTTPLSLDR